MGRTSLLGQEQIKQFIKPAVCATVIVVGLESSIILIIPHLSILWLPMNMFLSSDGNAHRRGTGLLDEASCHAGQKSDFGDYYLKQGKDLCENILNFCINPDTNMPMLGDWALGETKDSIKDNDPQTQNQMQQRFPNGRKTVSRSTDWMLAHYKQFKKASGRCTSVKIFLMAFYACTTHNKFVLTVLLCPHVTTEMA
jgi:hypothetical protein